MEKEKEIQTVMDNTGATRERAEESLRGRDVIAAIEFLSIVPPISGTKFIPPPPVVDNGHDAETLERITQGRILADILSASPKNDLRGKAAHYPERASSSVETTGVHFDQKTKKLE
jgi:hypothetical protein